MIDGVYYHGVYLFLITIITLVLYYKYNKANGRVRNIKSVGLIWAVTFAIFIGLRPNHQKFADTVGYVSSFIENQNRPFEFSLDVENVIFDNLSLWMASAGFHWSFFFVIIASLYFICRYVSCKKMFPNNTFAAYVVFLGAFITFASAVNGIKAGVAASIFCCAIAYRNNKALTALLLAISWGFHHSMHVCIAAFIAVNLYKNNKMYYYFWVVCLLMAIAHVSYFQNFFVNLTDEKGARYLMGNVDGWYTGMRYDFVLYSAMPILVGWFVNYKKKVEIEGYNFVLNLYLLLNGVWMLCMYANFTNRIAALSWFLYPIVLTYPFLSPAEIPGVNKNKIFAKILLLHLGFTLFMIILYN